MVFILILSVSCVDDVENIEVFYYTDEEYQLLSEHLDLPSELEDYSVKIPKHLFFEEIDENQSFISNSMARLGRVLFYDTRLSVSNETSCASCHQQQFAFSDNVAFSNGIAGQITSRNSLSLAAAPNLSASYSSHVSQTFFGWDHINPESQSQSKAALLNSAEMGNSDMDDVVRRLGQDPVYKLLARKAFGSHQLDEFLILHSLDHFMNSITAVDTRFDEGLSKSPGFSAFPDFSNFTEEENIGKHLFLKHCASCHGEKQDIQIKQSANNGLDLVYEDKGIGNLEGESYNGFFKIPFLRNVALTAPYMHDGRFNTLEEVVQHYNSGIQAHPNLSPELMKEPFSGTVDPVRLRLSDSQAEALVAFLHTLTDRSILEETKYSDPFRK